jgi:hypothetical protein
MPGEVFCWGSTARNMDPGTGDWELGIGNDPAMSQDTAQFNWSGAGSSEQFVLTYDTVSGSNWTMSGVDPILTNPDKPFTDMYIQLKGRPSTSQAHISITGTTLDVGGTVYNIPDFAAGYGETADLMWIRISDFGVQLSDTAFNLSGTLNINWNGTAPSRDNMGMHVKMTEIPEPTIICLLGLGGLLLRRRKIT